MRNTEALYTDPHTKFRCKPYYFRRNRGRCASQIAMNFICGAQQSSNRVIRWANRDTSAKRFARHVAQPNVPRPLGVLCGCAMWSLLVRFRHELPCIQIAFDRHTLMHPAILLMHVAILTDAVGQKTPTPVKESTVSMK